MAGNERVPLWSNNNNDSPPRGPVRAVNQGDFVRLNELNLRDELLVAVLNSNEPRLRQILKGISPEDLNGLYGNPHYGTALHIAVNNKKLNIAQLLLEAKADPNVRDTLGRGYCAIHYAADLCDIDMLELLLKHKADVNIKEGNGRTVLHILAQEWSSEKENEHRLMLEKLLKLRKTKIDILDNKKTSALMLSAKKGLEYMTKQLVLKGANMELMIRNKSIKDIINEKFANFFVGLDLSAIEKPQRNFVEDLFEVVTDNNVEELKEVINDIEQLDKDVKPKALNECHGRYTPLQYACDYGYDEVVEELLKEGADPMKKDDVTSYTPVLHACVNGYYKILETLVEYLKKSKRLEKGALKCADNKGETPLHKVVKREGKLKKGVDYYKCLQILLTNKNVIDIDALDEFKFTPLHYAVLSDDQSFVRCLLLNGANLGIKNDFGTLAITRIQPSILEEVLNECIKSNKNITDREFEIFLYYKMLAPSNNNGQPETECLKFLSESKSHRHLLLHPIIDTFLFLKWQKIRPYFYINIISYLLYLITISTYIFIYYGTIKEQTPEKEGNSTKFVAEEIKSMVLSENLALKIVLKFLILVSIFYICAREVIQFMVSWKMYISKFENWLEISIIVLTLVLLLIPIPQISQQSIAAWLILFSWIEFVLLLGRHPKYSVYITMFTTVCFNFLKLIMMFSLILLSMSCSFYLVFQENEHFVTYGKSLLKSIAMSTGELEYGDLPVDTYPFSSHLLFIVFVFLVVLVLMNLLNGLAVSDIQQIRQEAEIVSYRSRVELISYIESVFLTSPFQKIFCSSGQCLIGMCCNHVNPVVRFLNWMGRRTLMFKKCLQSHHIVMYPNRRTDRWKICDCHSFQLEESQIESAKSVVLESNASVVADKLASLEQRIDEVIDAVSSLTKLVQNHVLVPNTK